MCACVFVAENAQLNFGELKQFLLAKEIAKYKLPERLEIMRDFPLSRSGKVSKKALTEMITLKMNEEQKVMAALGVVGKLLPLAQIFRV